MAKWDELAWRDATAQAELGRRQSAAECLLAAQLEQARPWAGQHPPVAASCEWPKRSPGPTGFTDPSRMT